MLTIVASEKLAYLTKEWNPAETRSFDVLRYQYAVTLNFVSYVGLAAIGGLLTGHFAETMLAAGSFTLLRVFSGGFHFRSLDVCAIVTAAIFVAIPLLVAGPLAGYTALLTATAAVLVATRAPTNLQNTQWVRGSDCTRLATVKRAYKAIAVAIVLTNFIVDSDVMALAFITQALLLLPRREVSVQ
ncbi:accessory gene regulator B family protein [Paenibacillus elgii]|uniref:accessory gene regulator B family protein n=1 Tax=Paenibacillus elgii TaxID=189691 RepID=UPI000248DEDE|nr:accessory gene regulator B family protein [Paenibacillus elgii]